MTRLVLPDELFTSDSISVQGDELHYLSCVRRHRPGDSVEVRGAAGRRWVCRVEKIGKARAVLVPERELGRVRTSWPVSLIVAVPKRNLLDDVVRRVSEIGVEKLIPVLTERSVVRPGPGRMERWRKIARESLRQCGRDQPLVVEEVHPLEQALAACAGPCARFVLHPSQRGAGMVAALGRCDRAQPIAVAVGPEGGFTPGEIERAARLGFEQVRLGQPVMRVETAAIAAAVLCVAALGGFESID